MLSVFDTIQSVRQGEPEFIERRDEAQEGYLVQVEEEHTQREWEV